MQPTHLFAGLPVSDFGTARPWYARLLGREPDMLPQAGEAVWRLTSKGSIYVVADPERAGSGLVAIAVADLDAVASRLAAGGVAFERVLSRSGPPERLVAADADGNRITLFESPR
jgi:catechol 2,3-dioxygenase-like lactoylglutathione lyase family enzyme